MPASTLHIFKAPGMLRITHVVCAGVCLRQIAAVSRRQSTSTLLGLAQVANTSWVFISVSHLRCARTTSLKVQLGHAAAAAAAQRCLPASFRNTHPMCTAFVHPGPHCGGKDACCSTNTSATVALIAIDHLPAAPRIERDRCFGLAALVSSLAIE